MASIPCSIQLILPSTTNTSYLSSSSESKFSSKFLGIRKRLGWFRACRIGSKIGPCSGSRAKCWFKFGTNGVDAEGAGIYGSQGRDDYDRDDVGQYFEYMGMLAAEGSYDRMESLLSQNVHPVDVLLMMAASEGDKPKIEELLRAGALYTVKGSDGKTALDQSTDEIKEFILSFSAQKA
ncbi:PREDICTED: protein LHCP TRANSLOCATION DEFECT-like [Nelumbo nucifera]|uniref:Protein LHCP TRANSLOCATION DEFECT n=2 Tax=Nelumbo nucifera TaxID=4432 RepID=A0A1U8AWM6_NELNU|nr:PREDICTED: protein LHCP TRANSLOCATION DEFECT-like [Nelumbo nucifera]DAD23342.1 TPA_asm: hypothetical protein HUJ06_024805 [Nelumbo nucifera]